MAEIVLLEFDIWRAVKNLSKSQVLEAQGKPMWFKMAIDVDNKVRDKINKDPLLQAKMTAPASLSYNNITKILVNKAKELDKLFLKTDNATSAQKKKALEEFKKAIPPLMAKLKKDAEKGATDAWTNYVKTKEEYKTYKIKSACKITLEVANITVGAIGVAGSITTFGFSLITGLYGLTKSVSSLLTQVYKLAIDADKMQKKVEKSMKTLQTNYKKNKKPVSQLKQAGKGLLNFIFGTTVKTTINSTKSDNEQYLDKLKGVQVNAHKAAKQLNNCLQTLDKLSEAAKDVNSSKLKKNITKLEKEVDKKITQIQALNEKVEKGLVWQANTAALLEYLHKEESSKWVDLFEKGLVFVDLGLTAGSTDWKSAESVASAAFALVKEADNYLVENL